MLEELLTLTDAARELATYRGLIRYMLNRHKIEPLIVGRSQVITRKQLERIRPDVLAWKERPRLSSKPVPSA